VLFVVIVGCELAFWAFLLTGLAVRYLVRKPRLGALLLAFVPLTDLVLLAATLVHLRGDTATTAADGLAAAYLGVSVAFGPDLVRRMDARFAARFAHGPRPPRPPRYGKERASYEWREFRKALLAWAISCALLLGGYYLVGDSHRGAVLLAWIARLTLVLLIWLIWPVTYTLWPSKPKADGWLRRPVRSGGVRRATSRSRSARAGGGPGRRGWPGRSRRTTVRMRPRGRR
jgi:hypothetical protein